MVLDVFEVVVKENRTKDQVSWVSRSGNGLGVTFLQWSITEFRGSDEDGSSRNESTLSKQQNSKVHVWEYNAVSAGQYRKLLRIQGGHCNSKSQIGSLVDLPISLSIVNRMYM